MPPPDARVQILVVEDEAILALDLAELLVDEGYAVVGTAATGPAAQALFRQHRVDVLLCDIRLPGPWDGIETAARLLAERPVPLIYLTALADRATLARALPTAPAAYLAKPVSVAGLRAAIEVALHRFAAPAVPTEAPLQLPPSLPPPEVSAREPILRLDDHVFLKHNYQFVRLALADILLLEADNTSTRLFTAGPHYSLRLPLALALERLHCPALLRVHRSFAVHVAHVSSFSSTTATVGGRSVPLGRQYKAAFLEHFRGA